MLRFCHLAVPTINGFSLLIFFSAISFTTESITKQSFVDMVIRNCLLLAVISFSIHIYHFVATAVLNVRVSDDDQFCFVLAKRRRISREILFTLSRLRLIVSIFRLLARVGPVLEPTGRHSVAYRALWGSKGPQHIGSLYVAVLWGCKS